jgi:hypothetical protein
MRRRELNLLLERGLLPCALILFSTGLVLLFGFHMGAGALSVQAFAVNKLIWLNVHRVSAALVIAGVTAHVALYWRALVFRLTMTATGRRRVGLEPIFYAACCVSALTGLVAWLILDGSTPMFGPALIGGLSHVRHHWIDAHHIVSLLALALLADHVGHRFHVLTRSRRPRPPLTAPHAFS